MGGVSPGPRALEHWHPLPPAKEAAAELRAEDTAADAVVHRPVLAEPGGSAGASSAGSSASFSLSKEPSARRGSGDSAALASNTAKSTGAAVASAVRAEWQMPWRSGAMWAQGSRARLFGGLDIGASRDGSPPQAPTEQGGAEFGAIGAARGAPPTPCPPGPGLGVA